MPGQKHPCECHAWLSISHRRLWYGHLIKGRDLSSFFYNKWSFVKLFEKKSFLLAITCAKSKKMRRKKKKIKVRNPHQITTEKKGGEGGIFIFFNNLFFLAFYSSFFSLFSFFFLGG